MSTEIITTIIATAGVIFSGLISWYISRFTTKKEIEKMRLTWEREDTVSSDEEFADMASSVITYVMCENEFLRTPAMSNIAAIRAKETGRIADTLDQLYNAVLMGNRSMSNQLLTEIINQKREQKSQAKTPKVHKPKK